MDRNQDCPQPIKVLRGGAYLEFQIQVSNIGTRSDIRNALLSLGFPPLAYYVVEGAVSDVYQLHLLIAAPQVWMVLFGRIVASRTE